MTSPIPSGQTRQQYMEGIAYTAFSYGFVPVPLKGKIPTIPNWIHIRNNSEEDRKDLAAGKHPKNVRRVGHLIRARSADNVGIVTGEASGVVVFDVDTENNGVETWDQLVRSNSTEDNPFPSTLTVQTASGGRHYYFRYTPDMTLLGNINRVYRYPFDYRTNGGVAVFPGSIDSQNRQYKVMSGYNVETKEMNIAEMPAWLKTLLVMDRVVKETKEEVTPQTIANKAALLQITL